MNKTTYKVLAATGIPMCDEDLIKQEHFEVLTCDLKGQIQQMVEEFSPQIVIVSDQLSGEENLVKTILDLKNKYHYLRFIYLAGDIDIKDSSRLDALGMLVLVGVYDIIISSMINIDLILDAIENPKKEQSVRYLTKNLLSDKSEIENNISGLNYEVFTSENAEDVVIPNLFTFTSIKPGTGKTFISANVACAIAKYGKNRPKVALIDADMQTLSLGTLLSIDEKKGSLKTVMESISTIFDKGMLVDDNEKQKKVNKVIKNAMIPYQEISNLHVLVGSSLTPEEMEALAIIPEYFSYILDVLREEYDYIIVDTNSSILHVSSFPLLCKAKTCYYILNLDFNNVRNNIRYSNTLKEIGIFSKVKYILNENIENSKKFQYAGVEVEELNFTAEDLENEYFELIAKVPVLPKTVFLNRLYDGKPVVLDKNSVFYTNSAKFELLKIADQICELNSEYEKLKKIMEASTEKKPWFSSFSKSRKKEETTEQ